MDVMKLRLDQLYKAQQAALMRMQLWFTGETHRRMLEFTRQSRAMILEAGGAEGKFDGTKAFLAQSDLMLAWSDTFAGWMRLMEKTRQEAASLPFGVLAVYHEKLVRPVAEKAPLRPGGRVPPSATQIGGQLREAVKDSVYKPQLRAILQAADDWRVEGLGLSARIWKLDRETRDGINRVIMQGLTEQQSAWDVAKNLEQYLGADADLPRWTKTRIYGLTKADIASGARTGLVQDAAGRSQDVSYNALRLARTEIQRVHHLANDQQMAQMPWIEQEKINLSPSHPGSDECDDAADGGENGDGVYPKGDIELPLHPNCLCFKTAVQDLAAFGDNLSQWVRTGQGFPAMDQYASDLGVDLDSSLMERPTAQALAAWIDGSQEEIDARMK
jgi:hypothetical protein